MSTIIRLVFAGCAPTMYRYSAAVSYVRPEQPLSNFAGSDAATAYFKRGFSYRLIFPLDTGVVDDSMHSGFGWATCKIAQTKPQSSLATAVMAT